jgi:hypothetical protein
MAKKFSKKLYNSTRWQKIRHFVLTRDFYICRICGQHDSNQVHHIVELTPMNINDPNITLNPDNLITLCNQCHDEIHGRNYRREQERYSFDADGNIIEAQTQDDTKARKEYTEEQRAHITRLQAKLNG